MQNLRKRRKAAGLSRAQLGRAADVSAETIEAIEMRGRATSVVIALRIARALGTTVEDLTGGRRAS